MDLRTLAELHKLSQTAVSFTSLIGIASYADSPSTAYEAAISLGWDKKQSASCRFLAMIMRDYGHGKYRKFIMRHRPMFFEDVCSKKTHIRGHKAKDFINPAARGVRCSCGTWCFHAVHIYGNESNICDTCKLRSMLTPAAIRELDEEWGRTFREMPKIPGRKNVLIKTTQCRTEGDREIVLYCHYEVKTEDAAPEKFKEYDQSVESDESTDEETGDEECSSADEGGSRHARLRRVAAKIIDATGTDYPIFMFNNVIPDAFADGERICVSTGMIDIARDDHELAFIICHELAHNDSGHPRDKARRVQILKREVESTYRTSPGIIRAAVKAAATGVLLHAINMKAERESELEADAQAYALCAKSGFDPESGKWILNRIGSNPRGIIDRVFATHPSGGERIHNLRD